MGKKIQILQNTIKTKKSNCLKMCQPTKIQKTMAFSRKQMAV